MIVPMLMPCFVLCLNRAKTIKNSVMVNEELTAEEWKRRYERERDKAARYKAKLEKADAELARWRAGESVGQDEQVNLREAMEASTISVDLAPTPVAAPQVPPVTQVAPVSKSEWDTERERLYLQLDDKVRFYFSRTDSSRTLV